MLSSMAEITGSLFAHGAGGALRGATALAKRGTDALSRGGNALSRFFGAIGRPTSRAAGMGGSRRLGGETIDMVQDAAGVWTAPSRSTSVAQRGSSAVSIPGTGSTAVVPYSGGGAVAPYGGGGALATRGGSPIDDVIDVGVGGTRQIGAGGSPLMLGAGPGGAAGGGFWSRIMGGIGGFFGKMRDKFGSMFNKRTAGPSWGPGSSRNAGFSMSGTGGGASTYTGTTRAQFAEGVPSSKLRSNSTGGAGPVNDAVNDAAAAGAKKVSSNSGANNGLFEVIGKGPEGLTGVKTGGDVYTGFMGDTIGGVGRLLKGDFQGGLNYIGGKARGATREQFNQRVVTAAGVGLFGMPMVFSAKQAIFGDNLFGRG